VVVNLGLNKEEKERNNAELKQKAAWAVLKCHESQPGQGCRKRPFCFVDGYQGEGL